MKRKLWTLALIAIPLGLAPAPKAHAQGRESETVVRANMVIEEIVAKNKKGLPASLLRHAYAVAIFPNIIKGGFGIGGRFGTGLVLIREGEKWSFPIFATLGGGSFGLQVGIQSTDLVLVFKTRQSLDSFFEGEGKLTFGGDGSLAFGRRGRHAEAGTGVALKAQYVAFSRNRGLFAGASLAGSALSIDWRSNSIFYGRAVTPGDIILRNKLTVPESSLPSILALQATLTRKTRMGMAPVVPGEPVIEIPADGSEVIIEHDEPVTMDGRPIRQTPAPRRANPEDMPEVGQPELLPVPSDGPSAVAPRSSTTTKPAPTRPALPPAQDTNPSLPPLEAPSTGGATPKPEFRPIRPINPSKPS